MESSTDDPTPVIDFTPIQLETIIETSEPVSQGSLENSITEEQLIGSLAASTDGSPSTSDDVQSNPEQPTIDQMEEPLPPIVQVEDTTSQEEFQESDSPSPVDVVLHIPDEQKELRESVATEVIISDKMIDDSLAEATDTDPVEDATAKKADEPVPAYDPSLMPKLYTELTMLLTGTAFNAGNWVILLTKAMHIVSQVAGLDKNAKVLLSVDLVIKYLDEKTTLSDETLHILKSSVQQMCINLLDGQSQLKQVKSVPVSKDPDMRSSPQQIVNLLVTVIDNSIQKWTLETLMSQSTDIIRKCITIVQKFQHLTGIEKREVVISAITTIVDTRFRPILTAGSPEEVSVNLLLAGLPIMIDTLVAVGKGKPAFKFDFHDPQTQKCLTSVVSALFKLCKK